jgi:M6 family metalloprotease-like protein
VPQTEVYYANGNYGLTSVTWELIIDGLTLADPLVDFAQFDGDGDGWIDAITFLHSGYGAEWGADDQYGTPNWDRMWSHKWTIPTWTSAEGVKVGNYNISPALWGVSGDEAGHIGVVVHELGHFFGLPDLYDTGGGSQGSGNWDVMAGGAWGFDGSQQYPSHMSAWSKSKLGWLSPQPILPGAHSAPQVEMNPTVFRIDSGYPPGEYLLIENRQPVGFDGVIPQSGLAVWHVDESKGSLGNNNPNTDEGYPGQFGWPNNGRHYRVALLQADGFFDMENNVNRGDGGDVYHAAGVSSVTQGSTPDLRAYQDGNLIVNGNRIENVATSSSDMAFDYVDDSGPSVTTASLAVGLTGNPYTQALAASGGSGSLVWSEYVPDASYTVTDTGLNGFAAGGVAQGWQADEAVWAYDLPFRFPFWETSYGRLHVSSNGFIDVVPADPEPFVQSNYLRTSTRIAPLWMDLTTGSGGDVFIDESQPDRVTIRWAAERSFTGDLVNVAVALHRDGTIVFHYGSGNVNLSPVVGIGRGHSGGVELVDGYDGASTLTTASSIRFERQGSRIPRGLALAPDGTLSGTPTANGLFAPILRVTDSTFSYDQAQLSIEIRPLTSSGRLPGGGTSAGPFQDRP